jgi:hypothetical protein
MVKPGYKTTEFAVTVLTSLAALVAALAGQLSPRYAAIASAVSVGLYAVSRGLAKATAPAVLPVAPTTVVPPQA